ncbi:hypothetical protein SAMN05444395_101768 [Flavobacterium fryxellicola]|uniref:hypothetical protein n=1 Tax=Flavobacterium fryxellicola TaxID=249352 RepID=UPI000919A2E0|nr:hypothetical protein [Flavobacterium fryxellicola]SHN55206.1 hypothetical protein SAMN05444395_101768 [Flavobacterium fryxellicola]
MRISILFVFLITCCGFSQNNNRTYIQFDVAIPLKGNPDRGEIDPNGNTNKSWFLPDGLSSTIGYGLHYNQWIALGIHSGIDWKWHDKLVIVPVFINLKLSPKIGANTRLALQLGSGKAIALGRGALSGDYKKLSLGVQTPDDLIIFVELNQFKIPFGNLKENGSISLGLSLITF